VRSATRPKLRDGIPAFADVALAAIARSRQLVILTLNLRHFDPLGVATLNPLDPD
jgi:predicted nucleic acid-binding protein